MATVPAINVSELSDYYGPYSYGTDGDGDVIAYEPDSGWQKVWGIFDGIGGTAQRIEGIAGSLSGAVQHYADGDRALWEVRDRKSVV